MKMKIPTVLLTWTLESTEIDKRPYEKFRQGFIGTHAAARENENKGQVPLFIALPEEGGVAP